MNLLITDLDNTLYDWVTYFAHSFEAMTRALEQLVGVSREQLLDEFKQVHQRYGNSEQPFAALELPSVQAKFKTTDRGDLKVAIEAALSAFNAERKRHLVLYPGVHETLEAIKQRGIKIVGHTEAIALNATSRLRQLEIEEFFARLYALEGNVLAHPEPNRGGGLRRLEDPPGFVQIVTPAQRKPNPKLLLDICRREGVEPQNACYIGDSLSRDMMMAKDAGVTAVWAKYGVDYDRKLWSVLVRVTHWTDDDVRREELLRDRASHVSPDHTIGSFAELLRIVDHDPAPQLRVAHG